jgi:hypothetical protein
VRVNRKRFLYPESATILASAGALLGALAVGLTVLGNPASTGLCASCFLVNVAGAVGLHARESQSYLRPEILGIVLGAFFAATAAKEFRARGGGSPVRHFIGGAFILLGCEVFIGCPIKALLRTAGGGAAGLVGLAGLIAGILFATAYLREGFSLPVPRALPEGAGLLLPGAAFLLLALSAGIGESFAGPGFPSGARHAPFAASAAAGLLFGAVGQRTRFCVTGSVRTAALARDFREASGTVGFLLAALAVNLFTGAFTPTLSLEPGAHTDLPWAFLALGMVGFGAILVNGCPFRQLVRASSGDLDAAAAVAGMLLAAGLSVRWGIGSSPAGVTAAGKVAVLLGCAFFLALAAWKRKGE